MELPILNVQYQDLQQVARDHQQSYTESPPFPNGYFDDFFNPEFLEQVLQEYLENTASAERMAIQYSNPNEKKIASKGEQAFGPQTKRLVHFLNSEPFLQFLQTLTGIKEALLPDPYFEGGGFHKIERGGFLKLHVDFHKHRLTKLDRRLNILIYLNKDWDESYGGHFELWEKDMSKKVVSILPIFNRLALFSTSGYSWHGHPDPLTCPEGMSRKSIALYYYTNGRPESELSEDQRNRITTTFAERKGIDGADMKRYNGFVNLVNDLLPPIAVRWIKKFRKT